MDKTRLVEKRYRDEQNKEDWKNFNNQFQETKRPTKIQKRKQYELNKKRASIRKRNESNKKIK